MEAVTLTRHDWRKPRAPTQRRYAKALTTRERQALELAAMGLSDKQIAREMGGLSRRTVEGHLYRAGDKIGARRVEAAHLAQIIQFRGREPEVDAVWECEAVESAWCLRLDLPETPRYILPSIDAHIAVELQRVIAGLLGI